MKKLKQFFITLWKKISDLFTKIPAAAKEAVHVGVVVTENIKNFVESPVADVITNLIPGTVDDKIKQALREYLPVIFVNLKLADECKDATDPNEVALCAIRVLQSLDGNLKSSYLHTISVLATQMASDGKLNWSDALYLTQWYYQHRFKKAA